MTGFIGGGNMAEALIKGMTSRGVRDILVSEPREERRRELEQTYGVRATHSNTEVMASAEIVMLAVKPQSMDGVLTEIAGAVRDGQTIVSIAAGITLSYLQSKLSKGRLVRVMPNTPALVQEGMSVISFSDGLAGPVRDAVRDIFLCVGRVLVLPEDRMNAVTALSGSGPAFLALFVEAMIESGEKLGLDRADASELAVQTALGTARLLGTGMAPEHLRKMVTSPGGTTEAGLKVFGERGLRSIVADALSAARMRADELGRKV